MSMEYWSEEGYGFPLFNEDNFDKVVDFIVKYENYNETKTTDIKECKKDWELNEVIGEPVSCVVANIINRIEEVSLLAGYDCCGETKQEQMIGVVKFFPWQINKNQLINLQETNEILNKYAKVLGIKKEPDYFTAKYFG
ncbi:MAG: hypothetical protein IJT36_01700 [Alphaproteobacteria bacterium]|nr:hypothetical protein [Alphaproteobacteria bacterium]